MSGQQMWENYVRLNPKAKNCKHTEWAFDSVPDKLANLVLRGDKVATSSVFALYEEEGEELPVVGEYGVILDSKKNAVCIIRDTKVSVVPFGKVSKEHAFKEGEGDKSLEYWRDIHRPIHMMAYESIGKEFNEECEVVCEEFEVVYKPE